MKKHYFQLTHTNILEDSCSILAGSTCGREVPGYEEDFNISCRGEQSYTFECGTTPSGACMTKTYGLGTDLTIRFSNVALPSGNSCPALASPTALAAQSYSQNTIEAQAIPAP